MSDRASSPAPAPVPTTQQTVEIDTNDLQVKEEESPTLPSPTSSVAQNSEGPSSSPGRTRRTAAQRRAFLRDDPLAGEVEPRQVLCRGCRKWIRLSSKTEYSVNNWFTHKLRCPPTSPKTLRRTPSKPSFSPASRVATAERKIVLLNDPQVKNFSKGRVQCRTCRTAVDLEGGVDYELTKWTEHKETCIPMTRAPITPQGSQSRVFPPPSTSSTHSLVSVGRSARSPTPVCEGSSSHATETTAVAESSPAAVKVGGKRGREEETEEEEEDAEDARSTNRPRTETYTPPVKDGPSVFGWLMQPLKEFARGFREGLDST